MKDLPINTPAFVYIEDALSQSLDVLCNTQKAAACKILFSLKSFAIIDALLYMAPCINGFSASSFFEASLARDVIGTNGIVHVVTPGFKPGEMEKFAEIADYITFNSLSQWDRFARRASGKASCGLRLNPQLSFIKDKRYNPCRQHSKLGVPLTQLQKALSENDRLYTEIQGIHFHTNCNSETYGPLLTTIKHLDRQIPKLLSTISWINLGGGYLLKDANPAGLYDGIRLLKKKYELDIFIEPGQGVIEEAGYIVSSVIDIFESQGKNIAVLDTTVNHMPEVFEYQFKPDILEGSETGKYRYILAGCTCLAGDLFGEYSFDEPLEIGSKLVFANMGAYTLVKANMFNGVNLPSIYAYTQDGRLELKKEFTYEEFISRCGVNRNVLT